MKERAQIFSVLTNFLAYTAMILEQNEITSFLHRFKSHCRTAYEEMISDFVRYCGKTRTANLIQFLK
jgi:hypothetical protein